VSQKPAQNSAPPKIILDDSFYQIIANRRAAHNAELAAQGLPPLEDNSYLMSDSQAKAEAEARAKHRAAQAASLQAARHAPPPPSRGPLCRAAKAKLAERIASIDGFERHSRKCKVCRSPYLQQIEEAYIQWHPVEVISNYFQLDDSETLYRHVRAAGLDASRRQNVRWVVEQFIEQWRNVKVTSSTVIRSIRALSCLDDKGRWTDLPKTHILRRAPDVATATGLVEDAQNGAFTSSTAEFATPSSFERSEPLNETFPVAPVTTTFERSEPTHWKGTASAVPNRMPTTGVLTPEANVLENGGLQFPSFERSEPCAGISAPDFPKDRSVDAHFSSSERSEPTRVSARNSALPNNAGNESFTSTERSEPFHGRDSGLPENRSAVAQLPSFERSEPDRVSTSKIPDGEPLPNIEPQASSIELPEPNRVNTGN
jgi:hypothetical protein